MNTIEIYDIVKNIPHVNDEQARTMADTIAKVDTNELATKTDIKDMATKSDLKDLEVRLLRQLIGIAGIIIASNAFVIIVLKFFS